MPPDMQAKLMRVLQEGEIRPAGSNETSKADVRVIAASSSALRELVDKVLFREDLYYRLHVYPIEIPSLNDRKEDIPLLSAHFHRQFTALQKKQAHTFSEEIMD